MLLVSLSTTWMWLLPTGKSNGELSSVENDESEYYNWDSQWWWCWWELRQFRFEHPVCRKINLTAVSKCIREKYQPTEIFVEITKCHYELNLLTIKCNSKRVFSFGVDSTASECYIDVIYLKLHPLYFFFIIMCWTNCEISFAFKKNRFRILKKILPLSFKFFLLITFLFYKF